MALHLVLLREDINQRVHPLRELLNALCYVVHYGIAWRAMPNDPLLWHAVYDQASRWLCAGCFEVLAHDLRAVLRLAAGRAEEPTAAVLDSRTLRRTPESGHRAGWDGYKRTRGSKPHLAVDTPGHLLASRGRHGRCATVRSGARYASPSSGGAPMPGGAAGRALLGQSAAHRTGGDRRRGPIRLAEALSARRTVSSMAFRAWSESITMSCTAKPAPAVRPYRADAGASRWAATMPLWVPPMMCKPVPCPVGTAVSSGEGRDRRTGSVAGMVGIGAARVAFRHG